MARAGFNQPICQEDPIEDPSSKKKRNLFKKSETWAPSENDAVVTEEELKRKLNCEDELRLQGNLKKFVSRFLKDDDTADDVCQNTWAVMLTKVKEETIYESGLKRYVAKVAYGLIKNEQRRERDAHNRYVSCAMINEETGEEYEAEFPDRTKASPELTLLLKEVYEFLDPREQQVIFLDRQNGYKDVEIAEKLGLTEANVRTIRCRAGIKLSKYFRDNFYENNSRRR